MKKRGKAKFHIFPYGDWLFTAGEGDRAVTCRISSSIVCAASEVFAAMLSSGFKESEQKEITFKEEDPTTVLIFFPVIHDQTGKLEQYDGQQLLKLAIFADMWMCKAPLKEWVRAQLTSVVQQLSRGTEFGIIFPSLGNATFKKDQAVWDIDKRASHTYTQRMQFKGKMLSFSARDLVEIAYVFEINDLLWHASRFSLVYSMDIPQSIPCRVPFPSPEGSEGEINVHNIIATSSRKFTGAFVK